MAATTQPLPVSKLTCGFCGFVSPHFNADPNDVWAPYYRAVYSIGPPDSLSTSKPRLSGVGFHRHDREGNYVPAHAHQRWDELNPHTNSNLAPFDLVRIRDIKPPGPEVPAHEHASYAWGFLFHEACWGVLEQAVKPEEVDLGALWRILCSVPCGSELPNWGHNYGGLYMGTMRDQARGEHFVLLGRNSNLVIPSTFWNPFKVPELERLVSSHRIKEREEREKEAARAGYEDDQRPVSSFGPSGAKESFAALPLELKEMLMCYLKSADAANLRLASRAIASTPLTQHFFQSRFWPDREMAVYFDPFLLPQSEMRGTDWQKLYWLLKIRSKYNRVCLGERNRLRLWGSTIKYLAQAMEQIQCLSTLKGGPDWKWDSNASSLDSDWKICRTAKLQRPMIFGEIGRVVFRAEVELPTDKMIGVFVSLMEFFGSRYITGLRFVFQKSEDMEIGYILKGSEEYLLVYGGLGGFHCATDECGFRGLALVTGHDLVTEYLSWAGNPEALTIFPLESASTAGVRKIRASFDGFRLQALLIPDM
ncbi:hypothetical protein BKA67DRAFT_532487 [Truncatella angustata]|uniref:DUF7600 domain-containing protein n=1 Tax=Truncatella angustata TaxID=152316 RepID=A0A9P8ZZI1_9PEZI|nr:uncharacterized protein BKA67DRAFT_532487 [Truncatella angustata]KAH6657272.1 hypothetical protein BKA67DRAFT_532487 [Truncatella angustata]